jgi:hypothetical protein
MSAHAQARRQCSAEPTCPDKSEGIYSINLSITYFLWWCSYPFLLIS